MNVLNEKISKAKTICLLGHINPDGDCIGSTLGIYNYIKNKYNEEKMVKVYLEEASKKFDILSGFDKISHDLNDATKYDLCIVCDCASKDRLKDFAIYLDTAKDVFIIDHHQTNNLTYKDFVIDKDAPATCELVYENLEKEYIDKKVAECIYVGLAHDTGVFRYSSTTKRTMEIAGELMDKKIDFTYLLDYTMFMQSYEQKKAYSLVIDRSKFLCKGKVLFSYLNEEDLEKLNCNKKNIDFIVANLRETDNIKVAVFAYEIGKNIYKISLRSNGEEINLADFVVSFGGGGHKKAAGFTLKMSIEEVEKFLNEELIKIV